MEFKNLVLKNFMSYKLQAFDDLSEPELTLIAGSNGAGKSTVWDGICWAIFGQTVRGIKGDDVINRLYKRNCSVTVCIGIGSEEVVVVRYRKDSEHGDRFYYQYKGKKYELGSLADTQAALLKLLRIDFDLFRCSILFAQGETFNFVNETNAKQKETLSKVMRVNYSDSLAKAKAKLKDAKEKLTEVEGKIIALRGFLDEEPEDFDAQIAEWDRENKEEIKNNKERIKLMEKEISEIKTDSVDDIKDKKEKLQELSIKLIKSIDSLNRANAVGEAETKNLSAQNVKLAKLEGDCPTCFKPVDQAHSEAIIKENKAKIDDHAAQSAERKTKIVELRKKYDRACVEIEKLNDQISEARVNEEKIRNLKKGIAAFKDVIKQAESEKNPFHALKAKAEKKRAEVAEKIKLLEAESAGITTDIPYYEFWVNAFGDSGIKSFIFDLICSNLTNKSNKYLNILTNGEVTISFDTQKATKKGELREKFDCEIQKDGERVNYETYSGGEKRRISLAVDMALSEIMSEYYGQKFGMVVFDEQTNYMDDSGRTGFMNLLKEMSREKRVFVVDHDPTFKAMFDEVWTVVKKKGVSQVLM